MIERKEVEAFLAACEAGDAGWYGATDPPTVAALCRAWLAVQDAPRVYAGRVYDCDAGEDRAEILRTLPESMIGHVRIVKEVG